MFTRTLLCLCLGSILVVTPASGTLIVYSGNFSASNFIGGSSIPPDISGTFVSEVFDDSIVVGSGVENFTINLTSLSFTPSPYNGSTSFTTSNTGAYLSFADGIFGALTVGGTVTGVNGITIETNDFIVDYNDNGTLSGIQASLVEDTSGINSPLIQNGSFVQTVVPEPSSAALLLGAASLLALRRKR